MPAALVRVEKSSKLLEEASEMLKQDPYSSPARKRLIEGSGGILQVTIIITSSKLFIYLVNFFWVRQLLRSYSVLTNQKSGKSSENATGC